MAFTAGQKLRASDLNQVGVIVGRNQRTSNISTTGSIIRVLSTTASVVSGRTYRVTAFTAIDGATTEVISQTELRYTTDNTEPTTTSTVLNRAVINHQENAIPDNFGIEAYYDAAATGTFRVALCTQRVAGAGTITINAAATFPTTIVIEDMGPTVSTTGTVY